MPAGGFRVGSGEGPARGALAASHRDAAAAKGAEPDEASSALDRLGYAALGDLTLDDELYEQHAVEPQVVLSGYVRPRAAFERAAEWVRAACRFAERYGCPFLFAECRLVYGSVLYQTGRWEEA